jgi:hypothetical protein
LLHHRAYRAGYEGKGDNLLQLVRESVAEGMRDAVEGQDAKVCFGVADGPHFGFQY